MKSFVYIVAVGSNIRGLDKLKLDYNPDPIVLLSDTLIDTSIITLLSPSFGAATAATCVRGLRQHTSYIWPLIYIVMSFKMLPFINIRRKTLPCWCNY